MKTPFTTEQFFNVFEKYNSTVFPLQLIIIVFGIAALFLLHSGYSFKNKLIGSYLGLLWIWMGLVYHILFFTEINKAAFVFWGIFIFQGILILINTFIKDRLNFTFSLTAEDYIGYFLILFGLIIYPVIAYLAEGSYGRTIALGLPCPSVIFTFGFLLLTNKKLPKYLLIIPTLWAVIGLSAALNFGVYQDFMMLIAAITADIILIKRKNKMLHPANPNL
jgi:hypothetical protein